MALDFTAIDFETAGPQRASVCAVGLAKVRDGMVVDSCSGLVCPPTGPGSFADRNIAIHGITPQMVVHAPTWETVFRQVMAFVNGDILVAHNAPFDRSVMEQANTVLDIDWPSNAWFDTLSASRVMLTLGSYTLPFVSRALGLPEFEHHDAVSDAGAAARIAVAMAVRAQVDSLDNLQDHLRLAAGPNRLTKRESLDFSPLVGNMPLTGEMVAFTGKLTINTREEAVALVNQLGGVGQASVTKATTLLVTGDFDPRTFRPGASMSAKLQKAMACAEAGQRIEILTEDEFLGRIDLAREDLEQATRAQRTVVRSGWLPAYVVDQARMLRGSELTYNEWIRRALRHPAGRAVAGDICVRCGGPIDGALFWLLLERHVCSGDCAEALKQAAKREWRHAGISLPISPVWDPAWDA